MEVLKLPKKISILGIEYTVLILPKAKMPQAEGEPDQGESDYEARTIKLQAGMGQQQTLSTFLHEILHVALYHSGQRDSLGLTTHADEGLVLALETALEPLLTFKFLG